MYISVVDYLEETTKKNPDKIAFQDINEAFSFQELTIAAKKIGTTISNIIEPRNAVVVYMEKSAYNVASFMGAAYAGCFYTPIDGQMPVDRINLIMNCLKPGVILYDDSTKDKLHLLNTDIPLISFVEAVHTEINSTRLEEIHMSARTTDLLYVLFTSGSTGVPKGVTISHLAVIDFMEWICASYDLSEKTSLCNQAPFYFDASVPDLYIPLKTGATVYIPPKTYHTFPKKVLQYVEENQINTLFWVPSALCNVVNCRALEVRVPKCVQLIVFCGEVMPCRHLNVWKKYLPNCKYVNMYGPTEATYSCTYYNIDIDFSDDDKLPLGRSCENSAIILLDESNEIVRNGEIGEICIQGQCLSNGYYNSPEKTQEVFIQNPLNLNWSEMIYKTGDLARKDANGILYFEGRKDFQIKRLGHRIELGEIENAILSINAVESACCIYNEEDSKIIAVYTGKIEPDTVSKIIATKISRYMLPNQMFQLAAMPMNPNGKIDRVGIKKKYEKG